MSDETRPRYAVLRDGNAVRIVFNPGTEARTVCSREVEAEIRRVMGDGERDDARMLRRTN